MAEQLQGSQADSHSRAERTGQPSHQGKNRPGRIPT